MAISFLLVVLLLIAVAFMATTETTVITTANGRIQGYTEVVDGVTLDIYLGVPFAMPPVGDLRFKAPRPVLNWNDIINTTTQPNSCMQSPDESFGRFSGVEMWNANTNISEDCLYLNLWVPRTNDGSKLTTMLWIYGGSYIYGSITLDVYDGRYLAATNRVIVASMQYRMGVQGFLYLGTEDAPGNMGLLDQQLAMKWIYNNIDKFNGDQNRICLFGESSGAASISHHLLAPSSWPYFNNVILLSASSLSPWAVNTPRNLKYHTLDLAGIMNCPISNWSVVVECLRNKNAKDLEEKQWLLNNGNIGTFLPTVDGNFLQDYPQKLINSGKIKHADVMAGTTTDEGEFFLVYFYQNYFLPNRLWNPVPLNRSSFLEVVSQITGYKTGLEMELVLYTYEKANLQSKRGSYTDILDDLLGDTYFKCPVRDLCISHTKQTPTKGQTYMYTFDFRSSRNPWPSWMGSLHGYEIESVFGLSFDPALYYSSADREMSQNVMKYMTNFAKTGDPNNDGQGTSNTLPAWRPFEPSTETHISFSQHNGPVERHGFRTKECTLWTDLLPKVYQVVQNCRVSSADFLSSPRLLVIMFFNCIIVFLFQSF